jgi:hypothetical protein
LYNYEDVVNEKTYRFIEAFEENMWIIHDSLLSFRGITKLGVRHKHRTYFGSNDFIVCEYEKTKPCDDEMIMNVCQNLMDTLLERQ